MAMDWSAESDAWRDVLLSLEGCDTSDELLTALLDHEPFDGAPDHSSAALGCDHVGFRRSVEAGGAKRLRVSATGLHSQESSEEATVPPSPGRMAGVAKKKKKKRPSTTTKQTIERLRETVHEAECKLALLKARQQQCTISPADSDNDSTARVESTLTTTVWRDVVTRQYRWRRESEVANARLRAACHEQHKIMQGLEKLILRSRAMLQSQAPLTFAPVDIEGSRYARRVNDLMTVTSDMYTQVELGMLPEVANLGGLGTTASDPNNSVQRVVPCSPLSVSSAVWNYFCLSSGESDSYFRERIDASQDTVVKSFLMRFTNDTQTFNHRGIVVARRFPQLNGLDLIVYAADLEALEPEQEASVVHGFRTHVWTIARRSDEALGLSEVIIRHLTSPIATLLPNAPPKPTSSPGTPRTMRQFARLAQFSLGRHLERVQRAIDGAFL